MPLTAPDYTGIALVLGAGTTFLTGVGGIALQIFVVIRQGKQLRAFTELHDSVNGQTDEFKKLISKEAFGAGEKAGGEAERARGAT
jgi:hypothetical protein